VFGSDETYDPEWAQYIKTSDIMDKDGEPLVWRYTCNTKGSVNEEICVGLYSPARARIPTPP
jgi:hypothetical protein